MASLVAGAAIYAAGRLLPHEPESIIFDPNYASGIIAGVVAYLFGRSRRASFIAGIMGVILADIAQGIENIIRGIPAPTGFTRRRCSGCCSYIWLIGSFVGGSCR